MTLILSVMGEDETYFGISDIMISEPDSSETRKVTLPFRAEPHKFSHSGYRLCGACLKTFIRNRTLLQWSGSKAIAMTVVDVILQISENGNKFVDLEKYLSKFGLKSTELEQVSLIYDFYTTENVVMRYRHNCDNYEIYGHSAAVSGSGAWDFVENTQIQPLNTLTKNSLREALFVRIGKHFISEMSADDQYNFLYGGWFELTSIKDTGFLRETVAIKLWRLKKDNKIETSHGLFFSTYVRDNLFVCRIINNGTERETHLIEVPHLMTNKTVYNSNISEIKFNPSVTYHIIDVEGEDDFRVIVETYQQQSLSLSLSEMGGYELSIKKSLLEEISSIRTNARQDFEIYDLYNISQ